MQQQQAIILIGSAKRTSTKAFAIGEVQAVQYGTTHQWDKLGGDQPAAAFIGTLSPIVPRATENGAVCRKVNQELCLPVR